MSVLRHFSITFLAITLTSRRVTQRRPSTQSNIAREIAADRSAFELNGCFVFHANKSGAEMKIKRDIYTHFSFAKFMGHFSGRLVVLY